MIFVQPLLDLQEIDGRIRDLEREIKDIPERKNEESRGLFDAQEALERTRTSRREQESVIRATEAEIKASEEAIEELKSKQDDLKTNAEFKDFNLRITREQTQLDEARNRLKFKIDDLDTAKKHERTAEESLLKEKAEIDGYLKELDERLAEAKEELAKTEAERRAHLQTIPANLSSAVAKYEMISSRRWPAIVALNEKDACGGCHLVQPPYVAQSVKRNDKVVVCETCGRIIYHAE